MTSRGDQICGAVQAFGGGPKEQDRSPRADVFLIRARSGISGRDGLVPFGLLAIKSYLRENGIRVEVFDREHNANLDQLERAVKMAQPAIVGISAMTIQEKDARGLLLLVRDWVPGIKVVLGGPHFTADPKAGLRAGADCVVKGEGENAMLGLMAYGVPPGQNVTTAEPVQDLDSIPLPRMDDFTKDPTGWDRFPVLGARGCPYRCNYCLGADQRPKGIRYYSVPVLVEWIWNVYLKFGLRDFFLLDDVFVLRRERVMEFCAEVLRTIPVHLRFTCFTHSGHGDVNLYRLMLQAGFQRISFGVEHGNDRILKLSGKNTTRESIEETCRQMHEAGIPDIHCTYILGNIEETDSTISETVDFAIHLHRTYGTSSFFGFMQPVPGSPVYGIAKEYGRMLRGPGSNRHISFVPSGTTAGHMIRERDRGMRQANRRRVA